MSHTDMPHVQIAASSDPYVWTQQADETPVSVENGTIVTDGRADTQQAGMFALAPSIQVFGGEAISIAAIRPGGDRD